ncbi:TetR/AcrR family transcriptional regulator [Glycomyces luteolus]|uniref:TetR/AcrR family transcriptional regulator n=1 Tax=Glycomyces luteolus TaxID=2670330 RepID=A0A9X3P8P3_9ACTN|nr:TetR/AcrR family transcriptional regulator [Glycomyces luteolus]MDA1360367.1 TetR/AcrR family transcriptional regulator [Glycomyces luteolus]
MEHKSGLRERKKNATWELLRKTALELFEESGFEDVSVAEIAAAAEVSKATVFNYFPTKEDLVIGGMKRHTGDAARIVRERRKGQTPLEALREHYFHLLERRAPQVGLKDDPVFLRVQRLIIATPSLLIRAMDYRRQSAVMLAEALIEEGNPPLTSRLVASQVLHTQHIIVEVNVRRVLDGDPIDEIHSAAVSAAEHAFGLLEHGIGDLMRRETDPPPPDPAYAPDGCRIDYRQHAAEAVEESVEKVLADPGDDMLQTIAYPERR